MNVKVGIEIPRQLHQRLKIEAARRNMKIKDVCREAFEAWLAADGAVRDDEFTKQMGLAREAMARYHRTLKEMSR